MDTSRRPTRFLAAGTALSISLLTACAGGGGSNSSLDDTVSCLKSSGVSVSTDRVAEDEGRIGANLDRSWNTATIHFERSQDDADRTEATYYESWSDLDSGVPDLLRYRTVVVAFSEPATEEEVAQIVDCLPRELTDD